ncbi:putative metal-binding motif-containing protein [Flagellimonas sp.]|uniref:putative metal-binding motif-containing protein n=1 Tax=Flagellimonas sp. TaxID=2058762 RepID=UPI003B5C5C01
MRKPSIFHNLVMITMLAVLAGCSKDDGCEQKTFYFDGDNDGFGVETNTKLSCTKPTKYVDKKGDTDDGNKFIFPECPLITYYEDNDGDEYGNPEVTTTGCKDAPPDGFVANMDDCNDQDPDINPSVKVTYYLDSDDDGYGDPDKPKEFFICPDPPSTHVANNTDCNDNDPTINPEEIEIPGDGKDSNCDGSPGTIWNGPEITFSKEDNVDWTDPANQDRITDKVWFTRQNDENAPLYNYKWWQDTFQEDAVHVNNGNSDLWVDFNNAGMSAHLPIDIAPTGGTKGVRWAILDDTGFNSPRWSDFQFYGTLGDPTHFYSFHNILSAMYSLENADYQVSSIDNDFEVYSDEDDHSISLVNETLLIGKKLGVWLVEEDIYLTLTFTEYGVINLGDSAFSYTRSTPPSTN